MSASDLQKECPAPSAISKPGEVAEEYSKFLNDFKSERERRQEEEERANKEIISRLTEEDNKELERLRKDRERYSDQDEELARKIQEEINKVSILIKELVIKSFIMILTN